MCFAKYLVVLLDELSPLERSLFTCPVCDSVWVSGTVTFQASGFSLAQGRRIVQSGRLLSSSVRLTRSFTVDI